MKTNDLKELHHKTVTELQKMLYDTRYELNTARLDHTRGKLKNVRNLRTLRKNIAQIATILNGKELLNDKNA